MHFSHFVWGPWRCRLWVFSLLAALISGCGASPDDEADAVAKLKKDYGILTVPDRDGVVSSVSFLAIRDRQKAPEAIRLLPELVDVDSLNIQSMPLDDDDMAYVAKLRSLQELAANEAPIGDHAMEHLRGLSRITNLYLVGTDVSDKSIPIIGGFSKLVVLDLSQTQVSGDLSPLAGLKHLNWILLRGNKVPDGAFQTFGTLPKLSKISLQGAEYDEKALKEFTAAHPDIVVQTGPSAGLTGGGN